MSRQQLLQLGMFQIAAGGLSVLFLGILNRVLQGELGLDLFLVTLLVGGGHYLGAIVAIPFGYIQKTYRVAGYRRTASILIGTIVTVGMLVTTPWVAVWVAHAPTTGRVLIAFVFFLLEGTATFVAGTAYLALLIDKSTKTERGRATAIV